MKTIKVKDIELSNNSPIIVIAGLNVLEDKSMAIDVAAELKEITYNNNVPFIFKASFDKANRSSIESYRGPGIKNSIQIFEAIKKELDIPIITDIHEQGQIKEISEVVDILQIPAFLCRQTDLINAACQTQLPLNIKKGQFLSPSQMQNIIDKCKSFGNDNIILCERGSSFGYDNLVVDFLGISKQKSYNYPIILDVTHSLQLPGGRGSSAGGRSHQAEDLALAATALSISGLFIEVHPDPNKALCDGPSATKLEDFKNMLKKIKMLDDLVKSNNFMF